MILTNDLNSGAQTSGQGGEAREEKGEDAEAPEKATGLPDDEAQEVRYRMGSGWMCTFTHMWIIQVIRLHGPPATFVPRSLLTVILSWLS